MSSTSRKLSALILAGGTGGHVYPALAVAVALRSLGWQVQWLGSVGGMEAGLVPQAGIELHLVPVSGLRGKGAIRALGAPFMLVAALARSLTIVGRIRPSIVLGMGGFVSGPAGLAAWLLRRPLLIHEQNSVPGLTNRVLAPFARVVMEAFPGSFSGRKAVVARYTGNPVREAIGALRDNSTRPPRPGAPLRVLVLGGSLGAEALNAVMPAVARLVQAERGNGALSITHQAGHRNVERTRMQYRDICGVCVHPYLHDMASAYAGADLVVGRAGAMTVAELGAAGVGSVLVPFPHAVDDHQTSNARYLAERGAAVLLAQRDATADAIARILNECIDAPPMLDAMAENARACGVPDATERVVACCQEVANA